MLINGLSILKDILGNVRIIHIDMMNNLLLSSIPTLLFSSKNIVVFY